MASTPDGHVLLSTLKPLHLAIKDSAWQARGWTYQEAALSQRILFFTKLQIYFACAKMMYCESLQQPEAMQGEAKDGERERDGQCTQTTTAGWLPADIPLPGDDFSRTNRIDGLWSSPTATDLRRVTDHIRQFTARTLTYPDDILHAFRGVISRDKFNTFWGIPIAFSDHQSDSQDHQFCSLGLLRGLF